MTLAASTELFDLYRLSAPSMPKYVGLMNQLRNGKIEGVDFEDLVWQLLLRDTFRPGGLSVTPYFLNGKPAAELTLRFTDFISLEDITTFPLSLRNQPVLVRCLANHPRWDFASTLAFFQISRSDFQTHNKEEYTNISLSFKPNSELERALMALTGKKPTAKIEKGHFVVQPTCPKFIYITLAKPNHPGKFKEYNDLLVIAAQEVWK